MIESRIARGFQPSKPAEIVHPRGFKGKNHFGQIEPLNLGQFVGGALFVFGL
jgi:hypothetical protein